LIITGPTASGKKALALRAAQRFNGEIVSADSRKVYRYLDIVSAKPSPDDRARVPHHLIDIVNPDDPFSAGEWVRRAAAAVREILGQGRLPILSGGTGFYIQAYKEGLSQGIGPDAEIRAALQRRLQEYGPRTLYDELVRVDPERARELHANDAVRVVRSLEIRYATGLTRAEITSREKIAGGRHDYFSIAVCMDRNALYNRINERVDKMVRTGLLDEVKSLLEMGYSRDLLSLDTVGFKEWLPYLDGKASFESCVEAVKLDTRRYAKRQLTWFRNRSGYRWMNVTGAAEMEYCFREIQNWLNDRKSP